MFEVFGVLSVLSVGLLTWHYKSNKKRKGENCIKTIEDKKNGLYAWIQVKSDSNLSGKKENSRKRCSSTRSWKNCVHQISQKSSGEVKESTREHLANASAKSVTVQKGYEYSLSTISARSRSNYESDGLSSGKYRSSSIAIRNTPMWSDLEDDKEYFDSSQYITWTTKPHADKQEKNEDFLWDMTKGKLYEFPSNLNKNEKPRRQTHKKQSTKIKGTQNVPKIDKSKIKKVEEKDEQEIDKQMDEQEKKFTLEQPKEDNIDNNHNLNKNEKPRRQTHKKESTKTKGTQNVPKIDKSKIKKVEEEDEPKIDDQMEEPKNEEGYKESEFALEHAKEDNIDNNEIIDRSTARSETLPRIGAAQFRAPTF